MSDHVSVRKLIEYKCHDCTGGYAEGLKDCGDPGCPLYEYMPYGNSEPERPYLAWTPRGAGWRPKRVASPKALESLKRLHEAQRNGASADSTDKQDPPR
jgi:hypothetical protein